MRKTDTKTVMQRFGREATRATVRAMEGGRRGAFSMVRGGQEARDGQFEAITSEGAAHVRVLRKVD